MEARGKRAAFSKVRWARSVRPRRRQLPQGPSVCDKIAASSDCSRLVNDYVHIEASDLRRPNARFTTERQGYQVLTPFGKLGYSHFEGLDSERAIAWRAADSLSIRTFLDFALHEAPPDHSTLSRTRRLIDLETHQAVFTWVLQRLADATLVVGRTVGIDATTLEASAAMRSIVRRDTGESYDAFLTRLGPRRPASRPRRAPSWPGSTGPARRRARTRTGPTRTIRTRRSPR